MDEVLELFESAAVSTKEESDFKSFYKNTGRTGNQDERRRELLLSQKEDRKANVDKNRGILQLVQDFHTDLFKRPKAHWKPSVYVAGFQEVSNYRHVLMCSEWLMEKPSDFAENWLVLACPKGVRMLVIAYKGTTRCYNKFGNFRLECRTALPGGNPCEIKSNCNTCVLDCFYVKETNTMYVLDILAWNNCVMTEGEATFRQYWMESYLDIIEDLKVISKKNKLLFKLIPKVPCTKENLIELLSKFPYYEQNGPEVDGLLFYHSQAQYYSGETPLVGWLFPYMLPELLGEDIPMNQVYQLQKPADYVSYLDFIEKFEKKNSRQRQKKQLTPRKSQENGGHSEVTGEKPMETEIDAQNKVETMVPEIKPKNYEEVLESAMEAEIMELIK